MQALKYKMYAPPGGKWFYLVPETGRYFETSQNMNELLGKVVRHYGVNKLAVPANLQDLVEDYICRNIPFGACTGDDPRKPEDMPPTFYEVTEKLEKMFRGHRYEYVGAVEAKNRAGVCMQCPKNGHGMCTSCNRLQETARRFVGGRSLPEDKKLGVCLVLRVPANCLVHVRLAHTDLYGLTFPADCWASKEEGSPHG